MAITKNGSGRCIVSWPTVTSRSCIACNRAAWVLGGVRLISSARMMLAKIGPGTKRNARRPASGSSSTLVPVMSDGIRSGVNWIRLKLDVENPGDRADHQGLGQPGHADQEHVAPRENRRQDQLDHVALTDDDLVQLGDHHVARVAKFVEKLRNPIARG